MAARRKPRLRGKRGMGSVTEDKRSQTWQAAVPKLGKSSGEYWRKNFSSQQEADRWRIATVAKRDGGGFIAATRTTKLGEYCEHVVKNRTAIQETTRFKYMEAVTGAIQKHPIANIQIGDLKSSDVERFIDWGHRGGTNQSRLYQAFAVIRLSLNAAVADEILARNVASAVRKKSKPSQPTSRARNSVLTESEVGSLRQAAKGSPYEARFSLQLAFGLRVYEVTGLTWKQIDLTQGTLYVDRQLRFDKTLGKDHVVEYPKTPEGFRTIHLGSALTDLLRQRRIRQITEIIQEGDNRKEWRDPVNGKKYDFVFTRRDGCPLLNSYDHELWIALLDKAKVEHHRRYDMRHTAASHLLADQANSAPAVSAVLGHRNLSFTLDVYTKPLERDIRALGNAIDRTFS